MRKQNIVFVFILLLMFSACASSSSQQAELVYLKVESAVVSSFDDTPDWAPLPNAMAPFDGQVHTRWSSKLGIDNQWIWVDFGKPKTVTLIKLLWERAYASDYEILSSDDAQQWKRVVLMKNQTGAVNEISLEKPVHRRYFKILGLKRINPEWGISLWEVEFYGPQKANPDDKPIEETFVGHKTFTEEMKPKEIVLEEPLAGLGGFTATEFQRGVVYTSWGLDELGLPISDQTLEYLYAKGVRAVAIMIPWFQDTIESKLIWPDTQKDTPTDEALAHAINTCHRLGMKVMLKPHIDTKDGAWRGEILPSDEWFISYADFAVQYAKLSAKYNVELYNIGTELSNATLPSYADKWNEVIDKIKEHYQGPLLYGANWNEYHYVPFWKRMDFIGIDAYVPLTSQKNPTLDELKSAWGNWANKIEQWLKDEGLDKPVIFSEIGYSSADGTNIEPWKVFSGAGVIVDEQEQADCLQALFEVLVLKPWFKGVYLWQYFPQERFNPTGFLIRAKKAEEVLSHWYSQRIK